MSNLNPNQFAMFMSPDELIDTTNKFDSKFYDVWMGRASAPPRQQWEAPGSGGSSFGRPTSLRDEKLHDIEHQADYKKHFDHPTTATMPPITLRHYGAKRRPVIYNGHHRLAHGERLKMPWLPVEHEGPQ